VNSKSPNTSELTATFFLQFESVHQIQELGLRLTWFTQGFAAPPTFANGTGGYLPAGDTTTSHQLISNIKMSAIVKIQLVSDIKGSDSFFISSADIH
jgi:hypothetical protein